MNKINKSDDEDDDDDDHDDDYDDDDDDRCFRLLYVSNCCRVSSD